MLAVVLSCCVRLGIALSNETHGGPVPLLQLNQSAADQFIREANSLFVSNTTFEDLVNDNDTHQMFLRYRERKRQVRLKSIQQEILLKLGLEQEPNVTSGMSEQQRMRLLSSFDTFRDRNDTLTDE